MTDILELSGISKGFSGVSALCGVSFTLRAGEVHAVMGENGAGKSTLMKVIGGVHRPDAGSLSMAGRQVVLRHPGDAAALGVRTVFQELTVLPNLTVAANILIGQEPARLGGFWRDDRAGVRKAQAVLDRMGIDIDARRPASTLSTGQRQMVEIARAIIDPPRVLILDEPTSSLGRAEEEVLFALIAALKSDGVGIIYITHRMSEVFALSDRITVLRDGRHVATGATADLGRAALIRAMVGRSVDERAAGGDTGALPQAMAVQGITRGRVLRGADLDLRAGEVLGLAGLMGAGRTDLARVMAGIDRPDAGTMRLFDRPFAPASVAAAMAAAMAAGVAYLSEDRKSLGLVLPHSIADNIALPSLARLSRHGILRRGALRGLALDWMARLGVRAAGPDVAVETLSGGNQQKVALAKWLATAPRVVLLDEPTRGVDVGAKAEIYALIRQLAHNGAAVLMISSELSEVLQVADRIAVMAQGRVAGVVAAQDATEESLLNLAFAEVAA